MSAILISIENLEFTFEFLTFIPALHFTRMSTSQNFFTRSCTFQIIISLMALDFNNMFAWHHLSVYLCYTWLILLFAFKALSKALMTTIQFSHTIFKTFCRFVPRRIINCLNIRMTNISATMTTIEAFRTCFFATTLWNIFEIINCSYLCDIIVILTFQWKIITKK